MIDAVAINQSNMESKIFITRIMLLCQDATISFEIKRNQFTVKLAYSMSARHLSLSVFTLQESSSVTGSSMWPSQGLKIQTV